MADQGPGLVGLAESGPGQNVIDERGGGHDEAREDAADLGERWPDQPDRAQRKLSRGEWSFPWSGMGGIAGDQHAAWAAQMSHRIGADLIAQRVGVPFRP